MTLNAAVSAVPTLLIIWASLVACFVGLLTYRGQLTRYEDDQLFLAENNPDGQQQQYDIVRRVNQVQPFVRIFGVAAGAMTAGIVGIWVADAWTSYLHIVGLRRPPSLSGRFRTARPLRSSTSTDRRPCRTRAQMLAWRCLWCSTCSNVTARSPTLGIR